MPNQQPTGLPITRRVLLGTAAVLAAPAILRAQPAPIRIGFPVPLTGPYGAEAAGPGAVRAAWPSPSSTRPAG